MHQIRTHKYDSRWPRNISESLTAADANSVLNALTAQTAKAVDRNISRSAGQTPTIVHIDAIAVIVDANAKSVVVDALTEGTSNAGKVGIGTVARNALSARKSFVRSAARTLQENVERSAVRRKPVTVGTDGSLSRRTERRTDQQKGVEFEA